MDFDPGEVRCKGLALRNRLHFIGELYGEEARHETLARMPEELRDALVYGTVISGAWYPVGWLRELHHAGSAALAAGPELARKLGYVGALENFTGVHRIFLSIASPGAVMDRAPSVFNKYFDGGCLQMVEKRAGCGVARYSGCTGFDRNVWESVAGSCEAVLELARASAIRVHLTAGGGDQDDWAELTAYWC